MAKAKSVKLERTLKKLLSDSKKWGADHADILIYESQSTEYSHRAGEPEGIESARDVSATIRVFVGQSKAETSSTDISAASLKQTLKRAIEIAKSVPADPYAGPAPESLLATEIPDYQQSDDKTPTIKQLKSLAEKAEKAALAVDGVTNSNGASANTGTSRVILAMSNGFYAEKDSSYSSYYVSPVAEQNGEKVRDHEYSAEVLFRNLTAPEIVGREAGKKTVAKLNAKKLDSGSFPVIFDPDVSGSLVRAFYAAVSGDLIAQQKSFLLDDIGKPVFSENIVIIDDPTMKGRSNSRPFDREGMRPEKITLVEGGILKHNVVNIEQARKMGLELKKTTAADSVQIRGSAAASNLYMQAGDKSVDELIADIKDGFYVTGLLSTSQSLLDGTYSSGAEGFWIKDGKITFPVREMTIAGDLREMFATAEPADDLTFKRGVNAPTLRIQKMALGGN